MPGYRRGRINERLREEISGILMRVKDPRVSGNFVSITAVDCTADLKYAKIYYSVIGGEKERSDVRSGLDSAKGFIRGQISRAVDLRITPEITFIIDDSIAHGAYINQLLKSVLPEGGDAGETESNSENPNGGDENE